MKKRINLFPKQKPNQSTIRMQQRIRYYSTLIGVFMFIIFLGLTFLQIDLKRQIDAKKVEKEQISQYLLAHKNIESKTIYFINKQGQLRTFLKDDSQFLPYYNLLNESLSLSEEQPLLESMIIDKTKSTQFNVRFASYNSAYSFLKYLESEVFLKNFNELVLVSFSSSQDNLNPDIGYLLQFKGKFINLDDNRL